MRYKVLKCVPDMHTEVVTKYFKAYETFSKYFSHAKRIKMYHFGMKNTIKDS